MIKVCSEIVAELIQAHDAGKDINLNGLKQRYSRKHKAQNQPKLVDIIAAIPEQYKAALLPNLKAKPVRTASGVRSEIWRSEDNEGFARQKEHWIGLTPGHISRCRLLWLPSCASPTDALTLP